MSAAETFTDATAAPANIAQARKVLCAGGTWQGAAGPTYLKEGSKDVAVFYAGIGLFAVGMGGVLSGLYKVNACVPTYMSSPFLISTFLKYP